MAPGVGGACAPLPIRAIIIESTNQGQPPRTAMATKTTTPSQWLLERTNRKGYLEQVVYTGPLSRKPKGWIVVGEVHVGVLAGDG
jgi:hypothetical protein